MARAGHTESYLRLIITRGAGPIGLDPALAEQPCRVIIVAPFTPLDERLYQSGVGVLVVAVGRAAGGAVPKGAKSGNYLMNVMALGAARRKGAHEAIMLDTHGRITEGASSNVFAVVGGELCTPPLSVGILEGITRKKVIALAAAQGLEVKERELSPEDLYRAEEVFITSTLREILPVTRVDDRVVGNGRPGKVTRGVGEGYRQLTYLGRTRD